MVIICKSQSRNCNVGIVGVCIDFFFFFFSGRTEKCNLRILDSGCIEHFGFIGLMNEIDLFLKIKKKIGRKKFNYLINTLTLMCQRYHSMCNDPDSRLRGILRPNLDR
jgi:hypothetical protein